MSDLGRHGRNLAWLIGSEIFTKGLAIFYFYYLTHSLSEMDNAWYGLYVSFFPILVVINSMGFQDIISRDVAQNRDRVHGLVSSALLVQLGLFLVVLPAVWALTWALGYAPRLQLITLLAALGALIWSANTVHEAVLVAHERFKYLSMMNTVARTLVVAGGSVMLYFGYGVLAIVVYFIPITLFQLIGTFVLVRRVGGYRFAPARKDAQRLVLHGFPMAMGRFTSATYYRIDLPMLEALGPGNAYAFYSIGTRFFALLTTLPNTMESLFYPVLSRRAVEGDEAQQFAVERFIRFMAMAAMPIGIGTTVLGKDIVVSLCGTQWIPSIPAVIVLTWVIAFGMLDRAVVVFLRARGRQNRLMVLYSAALALKFVLAYLLIRWYSVPGLLVLNMVLTAVLTAVMLGAARCVLPGFRLMRVALLLGRPLIAALIMGAAIWGLRGQFIGWTIPLGAVVYGVALFAIGGVDAFDRRLIASALGKGAK